MADDAERTEHPTPRRLQEARERGQVAKSQDLTAAIMLLIGLVSLEWFGTKLFIRLFRVTSYLLGSSGEPFLRPSDMIELGSGAFLEMAYILLPILAAFSLLAAVVVLMQTGWLFTTHPLKPDLNKINPLQGITKLFSAQTAVTLLISVGKLTVLGSVVVYSLFECRQEIIAAAALAIPDLIGLAARILLCLGLRMVVVLLVLGLIDWMYQKHRHITSLRMSKQEVKEELRRMEGDPIMKRRRREVQMKLMYQRLRAHVPTADVVVTNPTHIAVALKYDRHTMRAPKVVAKGEGFVAQRIREIALECKVPIVEKKPLARALFKLVEVGQEIPMSLYRSVAEILAYVYDISGRREQMMAEGAAV